jgi:hypothetical protein
MREYPPSRVERKLRDLARQAHENELRRELGQLAEKFDEWRADKISAGELSYLIHKHDRGPLRDLYNRYNTLPARTLVVLAIVKGVLKEEEIPEEVWSYIDDAVEVMRADFSKVGTEKSGVERA